MVRSMKMMPRRRTSRPSVTWVALTTRPAASGGASSDQSKPSATALLAALAVGGRQQAVDRHLEQLEQVVGAVDAADGEGQLHRGDAGLLRKEQRGLGIVVGGIDHHLRRVAAEVLQQLVELAGARRDAGLGLQRADLLHAEPVVEVDPLLVVAQ